MSPREGLLYTQHEDIFDDSLQPCNPLLKGFYASILTLISFVTHVTQTP